MSQNLNFVLPFDGTNYSAIGKPACVFLKSIEFWKIVETGWIKPEDTYKITITQTSA
jgi:hypothetical protein